MAKIERELWTRGLPRRETVRAKTAFLDYFALGPRRSFAKLLVHYGEQLLHKRSVPTLREKTLKAWSRAFGWQQRIADINERVERATTAPNGPTEGATKSAPNRPQDVPDERGGKAAVDRPQGVPGAESAVCESTPQMSPSRPPGRRCSLCHEEPARRERAVCDSCFAITSTRPYSEYGHMLGRNWALYKRSIVGPRRTLVGGDKR